MSQSTHHTPSDCPWSWLIDGIERVLVLQHGASIEIALLCKVNDQTKLCCNSSQNVAEVAGTRAFVKTVADRSHWLKFGIVRPDLWSCHDWSTGAPLFSDRCKTSYLLFQVNRAMYRVPLTLVSFVDCRIWPFLFSLADWPCLAQACLLISSLEIV